MPDYTPEFEAEVETWATARIPDSRLPHVHGVVAKVDQLARRYAPDEIARVRLAGWIHDTAKHLDDEALLAEAARFDWPLRPIEQDVPQLLHGVIGYWQAAEVFDLDDPQLRDACALHTTGGPDMSVTSKIVMLGDAIEEATRDYPGLDTIRAAAHVDLDAALLRLVNRTLVYLVERRRLIDPRALELRNELLKQDLDEHPGF